MVLGWLIMLLGAVVAVAGVVMQLRGRGYSYGYARTPDDALPDERRLIRKGRWLNFLGMCILAGGALVSRIA